jgi:hypothetical protein
MKLQNFIIFHSFAYLFLQNMSQS